ncbi:MAG TPA: hypothetical protein VMY36_00055 [Patescibacteria group bacterium]|nr:hypothetical protein [Patescibacteria group bacterium]
MKVSPEPIISIIIPVGPERDFIVRGSLQSLVDKTRDKSRLEVLVKVDYGDDETMEAIKIYKALLPLRIIRMDGSKRGSELAKYADVLAEFSKGKLIWYWTDEARILTDGWEKTVYAKGVMADQFVVFFVNPSKMIGDIYPMITRRWYKTIGHFAAHMAHDSCCHVIAERLKGIVQYVKMDNILMKNSTFMKENPEYRHWKPEKDFYGDEIQAEITKDVEKIRKAHLEGEGL